MKAEEFQRRFELLRKMAHDLFDDAGDQMDEGQKASVVVMGIINDEDGLHDFNTTIGNSVGCENVILSLLAWHLAQVHIENCLGCRLAQIEEETDEFWKLMAGFLAHAADSIPGVEVQTMEIDNDDNASRHTH